MHHAPLLTAFGLAAAYVALHHGTLGTLHADWVFDRLTLLVLASGGMGAAGAPRADTLFPGVSLSGPSRTIIVEPLRTPEVLPERAPAPPAPTPPPAAPVPEPEREPQRTGR